MKFVEVVGEITPADRACEIEEERRNAVGRQFGDLAEDDGERDGGHQWLDDMPQRTQKGLFVGRNKVAPDEQGDEIAIPPELLEPPVEPAAMRSDAGGPGRIGGRRAESGERRLGGHKFEMLIKQKAETLKS